MNQIGGERQDQEGKSIKSKFRGTHLLSGLLKNISENLKTVKSGNLKLFSGVPATETAAITIRPQEEQQEEQTSEANKGRENGEGVEQQTQTSSDDNIHSS